MDYFKYLEIPYTSLENEEIKNKYKNKNKREQSVGSFTLSIQAHLFIASILLGISLRSLSNVFDPFGFPIKKVGVAG